MTWNRLITLLSIGGLVVGIFVASTLLAPTDPAKTSAAAPTLFDRFPVGKSVTVHLPSDAAEAFAADGDEQLRDWLLYATVFDSGIDAKNLQATLYDLPPVRSDYLRPVSGYSYGAMRWRRLPDGRVIVLVSGSDAEQNAQLGRAADEAYCNSNTIAPAFLVFEYVLAPDSGTASLKRKPDVEGKRLFSQEYGYRAATIDSVDALQSFLGSVTRLTAIEVQNGKAVASGRADALRAPGLIRPEDVAALWGSQKHVDEVKAQQDAIRQRVEEFKRTWEAKTYRTDEEKEELERQFKLEKAALEREIAAVPQREATASGFSLDPAYDFDKLTALFDKLRSLFEQIAAEKDAPIGSTDIEAAGIALQKKDAVPLLVLIDKASKSNNIGASLVGQIADMQTQKTQRQSARYDGLLQGTEVGMTLFYTDLLAKLWALDYRDSAPKYAQVANFVSLLRTPVNSVYVPELESLPGTRLWFGPDDNGFQKIGQPAPVVRFAARSTRIYAASNSPLTPGKESQPNANSAQFLGWWHDHYEAVAKYEPQYQRLDEIMKWSVAISHLSGQNALDSIAYLGNVHVEMNQWFPCWVEKHPELKFQEWKAIEFFDKRCSAPSRDLPTETMPLLKSVWYKGWQVSGGVSLASREAILEHPELSLKIPETLRRTGIDFASSEGNVLRTLSKVEYSLGEATAHEAVTTIKAPPAAKFRAATSEIRLAEVVTKFERDGSVLRTVTKVGNSEMASVSFAENADRVSVAVTRRDAARAAELLADLNEGQTPADIGEWAARRGDVATTIPIDNDHALVRLNGADQWMQVTRETQPSVDITDDAVLRAGKINGRPDHDPSWKVAWLDDRGVAQHLDSGEYVVVQLSDDPARGVVIKPSARGPPDGGQSVSSGGIRGTRVGKEIYVRRADLGGKPDPAVVRRFAKEIDVDQALAYAQEGRYEEFIAEVAKNPEKFEQEMPRTAAVLDGEIKSAVARGDAYDALALIARRAAYGGDMTRVNVHRAIASAMLEKPDVVARAVNDIAITRNVADEAIATINDALAGNLSEGARTDLHRVAAFFDFKRQSVGIKVTATRGNGTVDFQAELMDVQARAVKGATNTADTYVGADVPAGAWRRDTSQPGVDQIAYDPNLVEAYAIENRALALAHPTALVEAKKGVRYQAATNAVNAGARSYRSFSQRCPSATNPDRSGIADCVDKIYILRPRVSAPISAGP